MKNTKNALLAMAAGAAVFLAALPAHAGTVNVLWYTGGGSTVTGSAASYDAGVDQLAAQEENPGFNISGSVNTWNVTFWAGGAMPAGSFNVLVSMSPQGGWTTYPDFTDLVTAAPTFGNRIMLTGQDADWHYMNYPGPTNFDGPAGFLIDAINWAGSGKGLGYVDLGNPGWSAGLTFPGEGTDVGQDNTVDIPSAYATFPINLGLSSAGLSGWSTSAHVSFLGADPTLWTAINVGPDLEGGAGAPITIVSAGSAGGGTHGGAPDAASTLGLLGLALAGLAAARRRMLLV